MGRERSRQPWRIALLAGSLILAAAQSQAGALYNATALTAPNGWQQPTVEGLSNSGQVLFWNEFAPAGDATYSMYNPQNGSITKFVGTDVQSETTQFSPQHMSGSGQVLTGYVGVQPVLSSSGQTTALPGFDSAVNDSGQVLVARGGPMMFSIVSRGQETPLGGIPGYDSTRMTALNNNGQAAGTAIAGLYGGGNSTSQPVLWDGHRLVPLGTFGGTEGSAVGINNQVDVIGTALDAPGHSIPFVSHNGGALVPL